MAGQYLFLRGTLIFPAGLLDDLLVYSKMMDLHKLHLCWTFESLRSKKLNAGCAKCVFDQT